LTVPFRLLRALSFIRPLLLLNIATFKILPDNYSLAMPGDIDGDPVN